MINSYPKGPKQPQTGRSHWSGKKNKINNIHKPYQHKQSKHNISIWPIIGFGRWWGFGFRKINKIFEKGIFWLLFFGWGGWIQREILSLSHQAVIRGIGSTTWMGCTLLLKKLLSLIILWRWGWNDARRLGIQGSLRQPLRRWLFIIDRLAAKNRCWGTHGMGTRWRHWWGWIRARMDRSCKWSAFWVLRRSFCLVCITAEIVNHTSARVDRLLWCWRWGNNWVYPPWFCLVIDWFPILCMRITWWPEIIVFKCLWNWKGREKRKGNRG